MEVRIIFGCLCDAVGIHSVEARSLTHQMGTIRKCKEGENLGDFLVIEDVSSREVDLGPDLCPAGHERIVY